MVSHKNQATYQEKDKTLIDNQKIKEVQDTSIRCLPNEITILSETTESILVTSTRITSGEKVMIIESNHQIREGLLGEVTEEDNIFTADMHDFNLNNRPSRIFFDEAVGIEISVRHRDQTVVWNGLHLKRREFTGYEFIYTYAGLASTGTTFGRKLTAEKTDMGIHEPLTTHLSIVPLVEPTEVYYLDGRYALLNKFNGGGQKLGSIADGTDITDAVSKGQLNEVETKANKAITDNSTQDGKISANTAKVGITPEQASSIVINNSKVGITTSQANNIVTNTEKVGITPEQISNITTNNGKTGITTDQATEIVENTKKTGISSAQAAEITSNTNAAANTYRKDEHVSTSEGVGNAGRPVKLNSSGVIDSSMIDITSFTYQGNFKPTIEQEYPDTTGVDYGGIWSVSDADNGYSYTSGSLTGTMVNNGDMLVYGETSFSVIKSTFDSSMYYKLDGSAALTAALSGGAQKLSNIAQGTSSTDAVTKAQLDAVKVTADGAVAINHTQDTAISLNTAKTGISSSQASAINTNSSKVGITSQQSTDIINNTKKTGITPDQTSAIVVNSAKKGISSSQESAISANSSKVGITSEQSSAISVNTSKVGISPTQASDILTNNGKIGITSSQSSAISTNSSKVGISSSQASAISTNSGKTGVTSEVKSTTSESGTVRIKNMVSLTRSAYDAIGTKISDTLYVIKG